MVKAINKLPMPTKFAYYSWEFSQAKTQVKKRWKFYEILMLNKCKAKTSLSFALQYTEKKKRKLLFPHLASSVQNPRKRKQA